MNSFTIGWVVLFVIFLGATLAWTFYRSDIVLQHWAEANGYQIVEQEYRMLAHGPFFWTTSKGQTVYRVTVCDANGRLHRGWVRCGSWWLGLLVDQAEVRWDAD